MSISSEINRITNLRNSIRTKLMSLGLLQAPSPGPEPRSVTVGDDLSACNTAIQSINETTPCPITSTSRVDVAGYKYAQVYDADLVQSNIKKDVNILGITGTYEGSGGTPMTVGIGYITYGGSGSPHEIYASNPEYNRDGTTPYSGSTYDGFSVVTPVLDPNPTLLASNIKSGVTIEGVLGTYETQTQTKTITLGSSAPSPVTPDSGYHLSQVSLNIDASVINSDNIKNGVSILGVHGNMKELYVSQAFTSTGDPVPDEERYAFTVDLPDHLSSVSDIICFSCYDNNMSSSSLSNYENKIQSIFYLPTEQRINVITKNGNDYFITLNTDIELDISLNSTQQHPNRVMFQIKDKTTHQNVSLLKGAYIFSIVYKK